MFGMMRLLSAFGQFPHPQRPAGRPQLIKDANALRQGSRRHVGRHATANVLKAVRARFHREVELLIVVRQTGGLGLASLSAEGVSRLLQSFSVLANSP